MRGWLVRLRALLRPGSEYAGMDEELRYHVEQQTALNVQRGMSPAAARTAALRSMGGVEHHKDAMYDARGVGALEHARRDLVHAWRSLMRMPLTALVVVISLAVGIGINAAIFTWIQLVLLAPLPGVRDAGSYQLVEPTTANGGYPGMSWPEYQDARRETTAFRDLLGFSMVPLSVGEAPRNAREFGQLVSDNYFRALGLRPALGRLTDSSDAASGAAVAVVSHEYWRVRLAADSAAVGRDLIVNGRPVTVVGVAPEGFQGTVLGLEFAVWLPAPLSPTLFPGSSLDDRSQRGFHVMGLLEPSVRRDVATREVIALYDRLAQQYPASNDGIRAEVRPFWRAPTGPQQMLAAGLVVLQAIMLLLLLVVCGNTVNLMLARASARRREMAARLALGASRWRIASLVLSENFILAAAAGVLGALLAAWGTNALRAVPFIETFPIRFQTQVDGLTLVFVAALTLLCGLAFGLAPAIQLSGTDPQSALRDGYGSSPRGRSRNLLIATETGMALLVLIVAAMFFRSFREARSDTGFQQSGIMLAGYQIAGNPDEAAVVAFTDRLLRDLRALPGVEGAAVSGSVPLDIHGLPLRAFQLEGRASDSTPDRALMNTVTPGYFDVMGIALVAGRDFAPLSDAGAPRQVIVNQEFVRRFIGDGEPVGLRLTSRDQPYLIAGVVANSVYDAFGEPPRPIVYYSYRDLQYRGGQIHVRTRPGAEAPMGQAIERAVRAIDPSMPVYDVRTMSEHVDKNLFLRKVPARMFAVLGPLLLLLAAIGIYAVVDYAVARRTHEIGLRLALGASRPRVILLMVGQTLRSVAAGAVAGVFVALVIAMHTQRGVISLPIFLGVPLVLLLVAAFACWLPARRAAGVDPMVALRRE